MLESISTEWFVKGDDGAVSGPQPLATLRAWAREGRIVPGYEISEDGHSWIAAETVPDLEMIWKVE